MGSSTPNVPMDPNLGTAQTGAITNIQDQAQYTPQYQQAYYSQANNPYSGQAVQGAVAGGQAMQGQGYQNLSMANQFAGLPSQLAPAIQATYNTAYDPQRALYAQESQSNMDRTNAGLAQSGLSYTPWGAGVSNQSGQTFDTNWLATQLGRQQQGADTISSLYGTSAGAANTAANLGSTGANQISGGAMMPYGAQTTINQNTSAMLPYLTANQQQQAQDYISYYNPANQNTSNAINAGHYQDQYMTDIGTGVGQAAGAAYSSGALGSAATAAGSAATAAGSAIGDWVWPAMAFAI